MSDARCQEITDMELVERQEWEDLADVDPRTERGERHNDLMEMYGREI